MNGKYDFFTTRDFPPHHACFPKMRRLFVYPHCTYSAILSSGGWEVEGGGLSTKADSFLWNIRMAANDCRICHWNYHRPQRAFLLLHQLQPLCKVLHKSELLRCFRTILEISSTRTDFRSTLYRKHCSPDQHWLSFSWTAKILERLRL